MAPWMRIVSKIQVVFHLNEYLNVPPRRFSMQQFLINDLLCMLNSIGRACASVRMSNSLMCRIKFSWNAAPTPGRCILTTVRMFPSLDLQNSARGSKGPNDQQRLKTKNHTTYYLNRFSNRVVSSSSIIFDH